MQPSAARFPDDTLGVARTAAGFWNTTLSPMHAVWLAGTIARHYAGIIDGLLVDERDPPAVLSIPHARADTLMTALDDRIRAARAALALAAGLER